TLTAPRALELKATLAGAVGQSLDPTMVEEPATVEHDRGDALLFCPLRERLTNPLRAVGLGAGRALAQGRLQVRGRRQGVAGHVVDELTVDVRETAEHRQPWSLGGAAQRAPNAAVPLVAHGPIIRSLEHGCSYFLPLPPALPAFRRIVSSAYLMPLPL